MKIAMISPEIGPFAKTGGLADVVETLSQALARRGHEITLIMPAYRSVLRGEFALAVSPLRLSAPVSNRRVEFSLLETSLGENPSVYVYFVRADQYYDREFLYGTAAGDYSDNAERYVFFSRAALEVLRHRPVDIVHVHDWQAALSLVALKAQRERYRELAAAGAVFTIHNLGFQGIFRESDWHLLNLDRSLFTPRHLEFFGKINLLKGALIHADKITTVSPSYAEEIMTPEQGFGLEGVLRERVQDLSGILNGVDYNRWDPTKDPLIAQRYGEKTLTGKRTCKEALQLHLGLPPDPRKPLLGMISRLTPQKGFDLIEALFDQLLTRDIQLALLGSGDPHYEEFFTAAAARFPKKIAARIGFDDALAHQIEAGADIFLMPSRYEPCGLNQMFSLKYGTIPVVRSVGGLKDTVEDYNGTKGGGTGFVFHDYHPHALGEAIDRALQAFKDKRAWTTLCRRAMSMNFSWERSAQAYSELYQSLGAH
ncbi:MAG: glycogen synthase GlgA [Alphaproteobacteria bacterium]